jgi:RNA polymerase sigma-70 factor, ECF subfamily
MPTYGTPDSATTTAEFLFLTRTHSQCDSGPGPARRCARMSDERSPSQSGFDRDSLYAEFAPLVKRLLRQYGSDSEFRKDLAGEIYYRFCALVEAYDPERGVPLRPYLVRQLTTSVYTFVRSQWALQRRETHVDWSEGGNSCEPSYDPTRSWISALSERMLVESLPNAIAQLPERQRKVVCWRYFDDLPFDEIAGMLDIEPATVRSLLRHGINNLRKLMPAEEGAAVGP